MAHFDVTSVMASILIRRKRRQHRQYWITAAWTNTAPSRQ